MRGVSYSELGPCPECGGNAMDGIEWSPSNVSFDAYEDTVEHYDSELCVAPDVFVTWVRCHECGELLIEDGEAVHDDVDVEPREF